MSLELMTKFEKDLWNRGVDLVAGVDEVGRGSLAGPLVVCACIINKKHLFEYAENDPRVQLYSQVKDSKKLTARKRSILDEFLQSESISYSLVEIDNRQVDELGISAATQVAFFRAIKKLPVKPQHVLTDTFEIKKLAQQNQTNIVRGDNKSISIAAASIVAKVYRDQLMVDLHNNHEKYQKYGFDRHKGYGTQMHRDAIKEHGHSDVHRLSFKVK